MQEERNNNGKDIALDNEEIFYMKREDEQTARKPIDIYDKKLQIKLEEWLSKNKIEYKIIERKYSKDFRVFKKSHYERIYNEFMDTVPYMTKGEIEDKYAGMYVLVIDERLDRATFEKGGNVIFASPFEELVRKAQEKFEIQDYRTRPVYCYRKEEARPISLGSFGVAYAECERDKNFIHISGDSKIHLHNKDVIKKFRNKLIENDINYNEVFTGAGKTFSFENKEKVIEVRRKYLNKIQYKNIEEINNKWHKKYVCIGDVRFKEGCELELENDYWEERIHVLRDERISGGTVFSVCETLKEASDYIYNYNLKGIYVHYCTNEKDLGMTGVKIGNKFKSLFIK